MSNWRSSFFEDALATMFLVLQICFHAVPQLNAEPCARGVNEVLLGLCILLALGVVVRPASRVFYLIAVYAYAALYWVFERCPDDSHTPIEILTRTQALVAVVVTGFVVMHLSLGNFIRTVTFLDDDNRATPV